MIAFIQVYFLLPGYGSIIETYHSTKDPAWVAMDTLRYHTTFIRKIDFDQLVWC